MALEVWGIRHRLRCTDDEGQMAVELCVIFPVVIIVALIFVNALTFFGDCAAFDRISRNSIRLYATAISGEMAQGDIEDEILVDVKRRMDTENITCRTRGEVRTGGYLTITLTYHYEPTLFGQPLRTSVFGVSLPTLDHHINLTVDPYVPGKWLSTFA